MWYTYWWEFADEYDTMCGEQFFTELKSDNPLTHLNYAQKIFPGHKLHCIGFVTAEMAEMMGLDTY